MLNPFPFATSFVMKTPPPPVGLPLGRSVSINQAATLMQVSRRTIYYRIAQGRLQTVRTLGGSQRVLIESIHQQPKPMAAAKPGTPGKPIGHA